MAERPQTASFDPGADTGNPTDGGSSPSRSEVSLFLLGIFVGSFLLFLVQPLITKMMLPRYGGSAAVWNVALVFFQATLLLGYGYAFVLSKLRPGRRLAVIHGVFLALPLLVLPLAADGLLEPPPSAWPGFWVAASLVLTVGLPFLVLSTNSSLVQHWAAESGFKQPYRLYAASNLGSLLALLSYPFLIEPLLGLRTQGLVWSLGYVLFVAVTMSVIGVTTKLGQERPALSNASPQAASSRPVGVSRRVMWVVRAAVATSLLLSVTMAIQTDVASVPLMWVVPLAIYLATFTIAFAYPDWFAAGRLRSPTLIVVGLVFLFLFFPTSVGLVVHLLASLLVLLMGALVCHGDLAADRPDTSRLTEFYFWIALGGVIGGVLNSVAFPLLFDSVAEYPVTLAALGFILYLQPSRSDRLRVWLPGLATAFLTVCGLALPLLVLLDPGTNGLLILLFFGTVTAITILGSRLGSVFPVVFLLTAITLITGTIQRDPLVSAERSFFGIVRVRDVPGRRIMWHGTTVHGTQLSDPAVMDRPVAYYDPAGPLAKAVKNAPDSSRIGVLGLGTGALAAWTRPTHRLTFHEIDPVVVAVAERDFTFIKNAAGAVEMVLGDGRRTLEGVPDGGYDILLADAFSSDAIPIHLMTREALLLYLQKVGPDGLVLVHISNRHVDVIPVMRGFLEVASVYGAYTFFRPDEEALVRKAAPSEVVALSRSQSRIDSLMADPLWGPFPSGDKTVRWTDDYSNLLAVMKWSQGSE